MEIRRSEGTQGETETGAHARLDADERNERRMRVARRMFGERESERISSKLVKEKDVRKEESYRAKRLICVYLF